MKKLVCLFTSLSLVLVLILVGCSNQQSEASDSGKIQITFWHTEGGDLVKTLQEITDDFNKQSDSVHVRLVFQGSYDEIKNKFSTVAGSSAAPAVLMGEDNKSKFMAHSGAITPIYKFIKNDPNFDMSHMEKTFMPIMNLTGNCILCHSVRQIRSCITTKTCLKRQDWILITHRKHLRK